MYRVYVQSMTTQNLDVRVIYGVRLCSEYITHTHKHTYAHQYTNIHQYSDCGLGLLVVFRETCLCSTWNI